MGKWMIYGVTGYSGRLILAQALAEGLRPILAGRNAQALVELARPHGLETRAFSLDLPEAMAAHLEDIAVVTHCAGPFIRTAPPMVEACLLSKTHYLDITGEIDVFEWIHHPQQSQRAKDRGILLCPGVGFDVLPTDCLAKQLLEAFPQAKTLHLGFKSRSPLSPGTAQTMVEGLSQGIRVRRQGRIQTVAPQKRIIDFGDGPTTACPLSWGDVSTAFYTTGLNHITVWMPVTEIQASRLAWLHRGRWIFHLPLVTSILSALARRQKGPTENQRERHHTLVWGEVLDDAGNGHCLRLKTANGYRFTALSAVATAQALLGQAQPPCGSLTPATWLGSDFVYTLSGTERWHSDAP